MDFKISKIKHYYTLTKPGIIYGNLITMLAGFFFAAKGHINIFLLIMVSLGTCLIIGSACICNNFLDRDLDRKMERTKNRALVTGAISPYHAIIFAGILGVGAVVIFSTFTNMVTLFLSLIGFFDYVIFYTFGKRKSIHAPIIGSISGAMPLVIGFTSVTGRFNFEALLLFFILALWQMPHSYAITIYRYKEYAAAGIPVLSVRKSVKTAKIYLVFFILLFVIATSLLSLFHYSGFLFLFIMITAGIVWFVLGLKGFFTKNTLKWSRMMFFLSLLMVILLSLMLSLNNLLI